MSPLLVIAIGFVVGAVASLAVLAAWAYWAAKGIVIELGFD